MRKLIQVSLVLAAAMMLFSGCNPYNKMLKNIDRVEVATTPEVLALQGNTVPATITVTFPPKYFFEDMYMKVTPVLAFDGGEIAAAPKYFQGEDMRDNYTTVPWKKGGTYTWTVNLPYDERAALSTLELRIEGRQGDKCKAKYATFAPWTSIEAAQGVSNVPGLATPYAVIMPDNFKRITTITEEAEIHYLINSAQVRGNQLSQEQIKLFEEFVKENSSKEDVTLGSVHSKGYASPDGPEKFNDKLSGDRSKTGETAIKKNLKGVDLAYDAAAYGEDWDGFKKLVEASNMADKDLILQVLAMYDSSAKRDQEIKNLSKVYDELKKDILPKLRRTQFVVSADIEGKTDAEILSAVKKGDKSLTVEEMLYGAKLSDCADKAAAYKLAADTYGDARAYNNLGVVQMLEGKYDAAQSNIERAARISSDPVITNNLAAVAIAEGDLATAKKYLSSLNSADAKKNAGIIALKEGDSTAAIRQLDGYNLAVAETANGNYAAAKSALGSDKTGKADYLRAVISMRENNQSGAISYLNSAVQKQPELLAKAKKDIEFAKLFGTSEFENLR